MNYSLIKKISIPLLCALIVLFLFDKLNGYGSPIAATMGFVDWVFSMPGNIVVSGIVVILFIAVYFIPSIIADNRKHPNTTPIMVINLFFGWTLIGWFIALIWALTAIQQPQQSQ